MTQGTIIVFGGGEPVDDGTRLRVCSIAADLVIAADSGADRALEIGIRPDVVVGDLDSIDPVTLHTLSELHDVEIDRHPAAKDETDLELALLRALADHPTRVVVTAIDGGRADHHLANVLLLGDARFAAVDLDAELAGASVRVVRDARVLDAAPGDLVTLLPVGGSAEGITTVGLDYPLRGERLPAGSPRGVSNVCSKAGPTVEVAAGVVLALVMRHA